ncbi:major facilitator superfamily domain-containing protein [Zychaea mexicana]|uniref:major facilitator superfamily domain-containing protein n=1 Tax=Zychaea mexicana TaxID=64656 RepID=UPI0022FE52B0|nr:major facilitator superfamily domain-containing protein [Zychaea mexicana]KAI9495156.1 major facilitator superfamily domain-containing protein [Zychaea mexicana]
MEESNRIVEKTVHTGQQQQQQQMSSSLPATTPVVNPSNPNLQKKQQHIEDSPIANSLPTDHITDVDEYKPPTAEEIRRLTWKRDLRIIPLVFLFFLFSFLDRVNIGNAKLAGLMDDIKITEDQYNGALSIFFAGYIAFEIPANMMLNKLGPRVWMAILLVVWGTILASMASITTGTQLIVARFFLGVAEAGLLPAIYYYLSVWYTRKEQAQKVSLFLTSLSLSGAVGGLLAYGIVRMDGIHGMGGWQWIFIIEAIPTLVLSIVCFIALPDYPEKTGSTFLTEHERKVLLDMLRADAGPAPENDPEFSWKQFFSVFKDWVVYMYCITVIGVIVCIYSIGMFLPSIVRGMGFTSLNAQAMTVPPYILASITILINGHSAARCGERGLHVVASVLLSVVGYIMLIALQGDSLAGRYVATMLITTGAFSCYGSMGSWFTSNFAGRTKRSIAIATINCAGNLGGVIAGQLYRDNDAPYYIHGHGAALGFACATILFSLILKLLLRRINKKRDGLTGEERATIIAEEKADNLLEKHPDFRYIL